MLFFPVFSHPAAVFRLSERPSAPPFSCRRCGSQATTGTDKKAQSAVPGPQEKESLPLVRENSLRTGALEERVTVS